MLSVGLMSGTSMDGIDAALLETNGEDQIKELGHFSLPYPSTFKLALKASEYAVRSCEGDLGTAHLQYPTLVQEYLNSLSSKTSLKGFNSLEEVIHHSTKLHLEAVHSLLKKTKYNLSHIDVIGYHGQTLFHNALKKRSIAVGNGRYLADALGITVVDNFRANDLANGGQGAPFAPLYHYALAMRDKRYPAIVVNCGGIANISFIHTNQAQDLIGFDTGPGNGLIDRLVRERSQGLESMDTDGFYGKKGKVNNQVLEALFNKAIIKNGENYFYHPPPKSLDIGDMVLIPELDRLSIEDACATLERFTAETIVHGVELIGVAIPNQWILTGGGWNNPVIYNDLKECLKQKNKSAQIQTADAIGWNSQALEAQIFAYLAVRSLDNKPLTFPGTTGVGEPMSGGVVIRP